MSRQSGCGVIRDSVVVAIGPGFSRSRLVIVDRGISQDIRALALRVRVERDLGVTCFTTGKGDRERKLPTVAGPGLVAEGPYWYTSSTARASR